jgi:hypothetical protein
MDTPTDTQPHGGGVVNLIHDTIEVITEHSCAHRLTARLEERDDTGDDRVQGTEDCDQHMARVASPKTGEGSAEYNL